MDYGKACLEFNGIDDYLSAGPQPFCATDSDQNRGKHERTFEFMAKPEAQNGGLFQAGRTGVNGGDFSLRILDYAAEKWRINLWGNDIDVVLPGSIGSWHHYGVTVVDGSIRLYYDGMSMALANISELNAFNTLSNDFEIGRWKGSEYFKGQLREFRVWDKGMHGADLTPLKDTSIDTRQDNLINYWRMNEVSGATAYDYAGSNHLALSPNPAALHCTFQMEPAAEDGYYYVRIKDIDNYTVQSGDVLEYDIYWPTTGPTNNKIAVELETDDDKTLRGMGAVDQNGIDADPGTDLSQYTDNKWYRRRISLSLLVGKDIEKWFIACELNGGGETEAWIKNINVVSSGGTVRRSVWNSGDEKPHLGGDRSSDDDNGYDIMAQNSDGLIDGPSYVTLDPVPGHWEPRPTSNPASCWRGVIQGANNKRAIATTRLDLARLEAWHERCNTAGRSFNFVFDFASNVLDSLNTVAAVGRASTTMRDGLYSVVEDIAQDVPVQHFTPRNSWDFQGTKDFKEVPHAMRVRYADEDDDNQQGEISAFDDGYSEANAQIYQVLETKGITNKTEAWKWGRYTLAAMRLRPEAFSIMVDVESLVCQRGDLVRLSHDVASIGGGTGRIKQVRLDTNLGGTYLTLDEPVITETGKDYSIRIRTASGVSILQPATNTHIEQGETHELVLSGLFSEIAEGDLWMFGESTRETIECIVSEIVPGDNFTARLLLVPAAPDIYDAENGDIPTYDPFITWDPEVTKPVQKPIIQDVITDQRAMLIGADGSYTPQIILALSWESGLYFERADYMQVAIRPSGSQSPYQQVLWANVGPCAVIGGVQTRSYDVRVRGVTRLGRASDWVQRTVVVVGDQTPPPDVEQFWAIQQWGGRRRYSWVFADTLPPDYAGVSIRYRAGSDAAWGWSDLDPLHSGLLSGTQYETERPFEAGLYTFGIKAMDRAGNESVNAKIITAQFTSNAGNCCYIQDERANGWNGTRDNCFVNATLGVDKVGELESIDTSTWDNLGDTTWDTWLAWHTTHLPLTYTTIPITLAEANFITPLKATIQAAGDGLLTIQARRSFDNGATWGEWYTLPPSGEDNIGENSACLWQAKITASPASGEQICILREMLIYFETV
ncbi:phage tail protein [bacterium]|nr:phage tail protein [bacterium]